MTRIDADAMADSGGDPLLLVGGQAVALAVRLQASGYQPLDWGSGAASGVSVDGRSHPVAAILADDQADRISDLRSRFGALPILIGVKDDSVAAREHVFACGADDFWFPSVGPSDLLQRLRLHLAIQAQSQQRRPMMQIADLRVDLASRQVRRGSRPIALTAREYSLLLLLLEQRGTVVSRDRILREVWNDEQGSSSNVIEVYVRYLRQKLEESGEARLIHTIRGRGYCLSDGIPKLDPR